MSGSASLSRQKQLDEILAVRGKAAPTAAQKEATVAKDSRFASIETNPFFQAIFDEALSPEAKQAAVTKLLTFTGTREANRDWNQRGLRPETICHSVRRWFVQLEYDISSFYYKVRRWDW